jgi:hypothetical protein
MHIFKLIAGYLVTVEVRMKIIRPMKHFYGSGVEKRGAGAPAPNGARGVLAPIPFPPSPGGMETPGQPIVDTCGGKCYTLDNEIYDILYCTCCSHTNSHNHANTTRRSTAGNVISLA